MRLAIGSVASQHALDACHQFARVEGLGDVVIRAELEPGDAIRHIAACSEHDHRHAVAAPDFLADRKAILAGQHHVEQHQVRARGRQPAQALLAVEDAVHFDLVPLAIGAQQLRVAPVVVDEKHMDHTVILSRVGVERHPLQFKAQRLPIDGPQHPQAGERKAQQHQGQRAGANRPAGKVQGCVELPLAIAQVLHMHGSLSPGWVNCQW